MERQASRRPPRRRRAASAAGLLALVAAALWTVRPLPAAAYDPSAAERRGPIGPAPSRDLDISIEALPASVHAALDCSDCHVRSGEAGATEQDFRAGEAQCLGCHEDADRDYALSVHAEARDDGSLYAARCQDCHGAHDVRAPSDPLAHVSVRRVGYTCAGCHGDEPRAEWLGIADPRAFDTYRESIHGEVLLEKGTTAAPACVSCHGGHSIFSKDDVRSTVHPSNVDATCGGSCHAGVEAEVARSVHGLRAGEDAATCIDCHAAHDIQAKNETFRMQADRLCGSCHEERLEQHLGTYHGRAHALGGSDVAACFDCHGSHGMRSTSDPESTVALGNRIETCRRCHEDAPAAFASYVAHADPGDRASQPVLHDTAWSIRGTLAVALVLLLLHTAAWFGRSGVAAAANPTRFMRILRQRARERDRIAANRFGAIDQLCHGLLLLSFVVLITTGAPLVFHDSGWAQTVFGWLGGADVARSLHRVGAVLTAVYVVVHLATIVSRAWTGRDAHRDDGGKFRWRLFLGSLFGPGSPLPNRSDLRHVLAHVKWFVGRGPLPPVVRYPYWEKLDYVATFFAVAVVGTSGAMIWASEIVTHVIPGWTLNVAQLVHGEEALLAAMLVFLLHAFHVVPTLLRRRAVQPRAQLPRPPTVPQRAAQD